ncbi:MAG TPA: hypothetical protein DGQ38_15285 [Zunongwangia profunda]|uniref:DUF2231 domain-containing protein n=1 Tax=Zunongwangia profunda TaxID=398743 RepID=A0A3D5J370_9FLAO|nr:hypothetical protein [Zunongwangia profunda]|tara:strand:- start:3470 stop:3880 length:411 start_codon:yes stop_codon:yes gene_type:complete
MFIDLHPLVIHFPIALLSSAILFDFIGIIFNNKELLVTSWWVMLLALISSSGAIITGFIDDDLIGHFNNTFPIWKNHGLIQIISLISFSSLFVWRTKQIGLFHSIKLVWIYLLLSLINVVTLFYGAHLGAQLAGRI